MYRDDYKFCMDRVESDPMWAVAGALFAIADSIHSGSRHLGTQDAATPMGALEMLAMEIKEGLGNIADALTKDD
jgi:hypothetical protein